MQKIYIAKPGGQKEGPFSLEQINQDLATKRIRDAEFWAWHDGLPAWIPLYAIPGVSAKAKDAAAREAKIQTVTPKAAPETLTPQAKPVPRVSMVEVAMLPASKSETHMPKAEATTATAVIPEAETPKVKVAPSREESKAEPASAPGTEAEPETPKVQVAAGPRAKPEPEEPKSEAAGPAVAEVAAATPKAEPRAAVKSEKAAPQTGSEPELPELFATPSMSSGKPFTALEQIFIFTTGEGPSAFKSAITSAMVSEAVGETLENIRAKIPVDVMGGANASVLEAFRAGSIPGSVWRALFKIKPAVAQQAQDGVYHLCVRTFPMESKELVALFLLYNKQKL